MNRKASASITGTVLIVALLVTGALQGLRAEEEAALLQQAQAVFKPLPQDMGTPEFPITPARVAGCSGLRPMSDPITSPSLINALAAASPPVRVIDQRQPGGTDRP